MNKIQNPKMTWAIIISFLLVPLCVSVISTIHVIRFFEISNNPALAFTLAISFELGALSALAGLVAMDKINRKVVWFIFVLLTFFQVLGNTYFAYDTISIKMITQPDLIRNWTELVGLQDEDPILIKRIISILSGGILPIVSLAFLDLLVDFIRKTFGMEENKKFDSSEEIPSEENSVIEVKEEKKTEIQNESVEESSEQKLEEISKDNVVEDYEQEDFERLLDEKKKRLNNMREPYFEMLQVLYNDGAINNGDELPNYNDFIAKLDMNRFSQKEINLFLTLCNYLEIFKVSNTQKIALKTLDEAKEILSNYLTLGD